MSEKEKVIKLLLWGGDNSDDIAFKLPVAVNQALLFMTNGAVGVGKLDEDLLESVFNDKKEVGKQLWFPEM